MARSILDHTGERAAAGRDAPPPNDESLSVIDDLTGAYDLIAADDLDAELSDAGEEAAETPETPLTSKRARARRAVKSTRKRR